VAGAAQPVVPNTMLAVAANKLYVIPGSHPSATAMMMLKRKGIPFKRVDLIPVVSKGVLKAQRFPGVTVPALKLDGRRVQGSREIARELDRVRPDPPLLPSDPQSRAAVEQAEAWGDTFQQKPRRFTWWAFKRDRAPMASYSEGARLGLPVGLAVKTGGPIVALSARFNGATDENVRADLASLPADLDRIDGWIADGVMGGDEPNAADYQIAPSLRLLMTFDDLLPAIEPRPGGQLATRLMPDFKGRMPPVFPAEWLAPLRGGA
jgi:glutathione S-transferase